MTIKSFGTFGSDKAPVDEMITFSSKVSPGNELASLPVAMMMFLAVICSLFPSLSVTSLNCFTKNLHCVWINESSEAFHVSDFVLFEKAFDTFCQWSHNTVFVLLNFRPVKVAALYFDTHFCEVMVKFVVFVRNVQQGFGGDATYVKAGSSETASFFNADSVETQLSCFDGGDVTLDKWEKYLQVHLRWRRDRRLWWRIYKRDYF